VWINPRRVKRSFDPEPDRISKSPLYIATPCVYNDGIFDDKNDGVKYARTISNSSHNGCTTRSIAQPITTFHRCGERSSRNALIVAAVERYLQELERQEIDRQFEAMADDSAYQALNEELVEAFADSDWEALAEDEQG